MPGVTCGASPNDPGYLSAIQAVSMASNATIAALAAEPYCERGSGRASSIVTISLSSSLS